MAQTDVLRSNALLKVMHHFGWTPGCALHNAVCACDSRDMGHGIPFLEVNLVSCLTWLIRHSLFECGSGFSKQALKLKLQGPSLVPRLWT